MRFVLFVFFAGYKYVTGKFITLASVFVLSMFAFGYGQYLLYGIGAKYDYYFLNSYYAGLYNNNKALLTASVQYTLIGLELFCLAIMAAGREKIPPTTTHMALSWSGYTVPCSAFRTTARHLRTGTLC